MGRSVGGLCSRTGASLVLVYSPELLESVELPGPGQVCEPEGGDAQAADKVDRIVKGGAVSEDHAVVAMDRRSLADVECARDEYPDMASNEISHW